jgi:hypothetical protein
MKVNIKNKGIFPSHGVAAAGSWGKSLYLADQDSFP